MPSGHGHADVARLLEHSVDTEAQDDNKYTPLLLASRSEYKYPRSVKSRKRDWLWLTGCGPHAEGHDKPGGGVGAGWARCSNAQN